MPVKHYENFPVASWLLPRRLHKPVAAIYAFARSADDIADEGDLDAQTRRDRLAGYRAELANIAQGLPSGDPMFGRLAEAIDGHGLPLAPFTDLLDAFGQDLTKPRYASFAELLDYCRRSANPIGRLLLRLFGAESAEQLAWSDAICSGLQLVNHWQDIALDWRRGRVYLPREDLDRFRVGEAQIAAGKTDGNWRRLLAFELERSRAMLLGGAPLARTLPGRIGVELRLIVAGGLAILKKIEAVDYDVFRRRPRLTAFDWPVLVAKALIP